MVFKAGKENIRYGKKPHNFKGGTIRRGYKILSFGEKKIPEHRHKWEKETGQKVPEGFILHHINGDKLDNRIENLALMKQGDHLRIHNTCGWNKKEIDLELMKKLYYEKEWDYRKLARHFGFKSISPISNRFKKLGLKARHNEETKKGFKHTEETKKRISKTLKEKKD